MRFKKHHGRTQCRNGDDKTEKGENGHAEQDKKHTDCRECKSDAKIWKSFETTTDSIHDDLLSLKRFRMDPIPIP